MKVLLFILSSVVLVYARPEAGYAYGPPSFSSAGFGSSSIGIGGSGSGATEFVSSGSGSSSSFTSGSAGSSFSSGSGSSSFSSGGDASFTGFAPAVTKHVYVHVPQPEQETKRPPQFIPVHQAQKHYKIIFIKAPAPPTYQAPIIPVQPQDEEKTIVYVLSKRPEEQPDIIVPTPAPTQPSKPEVYFIKYKTQKEQAAASSSGSSSAGNIVLSGSNTGSASSVVSSSGSQSSSGQGTGYPAPVYGPAH